MGYLFKKILNVTRMSASLCRVLRKAGILSINLNKLFGMLQKSERNVNFWRKLTENRLHQVKVGNFANCTVAELVQKFGKSREITYGMQ